MYLVVFLLFLVIALSMTYTFTQENYRSYGVIPEEDRKTGLKVQQLDKIYPGLSSNLLEEEHSYWKP